jgi:ATP-dependent helicase/DNAse subunit B
MSADVPSDGALVLSRPGAAVNRRSMSNPVGPVPLTLVTGPANAEKAGFVLGAYRAALEEEPILVVPTFADVDHYRRELAGAGAVFGVRVVAFSGLMREIARRGGVGGRALSRLARERVAGAAIARVRLEALAAAAATPGFVEALLRLVTELEEQRIATGRWWAAMRAWGEREPARAAYAEELARLYGAYRDGLRAIDRRDRVLHDQVALDALRLEPARWGATPVFLYGFDDLQPLQRDAIETLAVHAGAPVTVSLAYEPGRAAFAGRGETFQELMALGPDHVELPALAEHYERPALHALERTLFEPPASERQDPGDALMLLEGGGERAEIELVGAHVARLIGERAFAPEDVAVVLREPREHAALLEQVFGELEIPYALDRMIAAGHTALGRGLVALLRCALASGSADDLLAWLRTPGKLARPDLADRLEQRARIEGKATAAQARELWEADHPDFVLHEIDRVAAAAGDPAALCRRLSAECGALFAAPHRGEARVLAGPEALDARVAGALRSALGELGRLAAVDRALVPAPEELARVLHDIDVRAHDDRRPGLVAIASPRELRARRVRAAFLCGMREDAFPRPATPEPFLGDDERRALNAASGLRLRLREDRLDAERYLLYAVASRPTELLALSWHAADDEGEPCVRSLFVDDVLDSFDPRAAERVERRVLGAAGFEAALAPTANEAARQELAAGPGSPEPAMAWLRDARVLRDLNERATWSASALESYASCPVKWFVERLLRPAALEPDPEPMLRGDLAHRVLEDTLRALSDGGPLTPERLDEARALVRAALDARADDARISPNPERRRSALRRLEADLLRYVEQAARGHSAFAPREFELRFGGPEDKLGPAELAGGELRLQGRIDRIDVSPGGGEAIVYDYKGKGAPPQARWLDDANLQVGLYLLALPQLLDLEAVGGLYQPLGRDDDGRPRGLLLDGADPGLTSVSKDRLPSEEFEALLQEVLGAALQAVRGIRSGALVPDPTSCAYRGGCAHPTICRCEAASA